MNTDQRNDPQIVCDGMPTMMGCSGEIKAGRTNWSKAGTKRNGWYVTPATDDIYGKLTVPEFLCYFCPRCAVIVKAQEKRAVPPHD